MKNGITKTIFLFLLMGITNVASAQADGGGTDSFIYLLIAVAVLIFFYLIIQVADNLLAIEARQSGADKDGSNFSIFPRLNELFAPKLPDYVADKPVTILKRGYDLLLQGGAHNQYGDLPSTSRTFAVQPPDFVGIAPIPKVLVEIGAKVKAGDPILFDKTKPDIKHVAPVSGEIVAVNRGAKRAINEVVILADKEIEYKKFPSFDLEGGSREDLVNYLMDSGAWILIRQRPFNIIPDPNEIPRDIFISTFDTAPLAPDLNFVAEGQSASFQKGLDVLNKLTDGKVHLGLNAKGSEAPSSVFSDAQGVELHWFHGKHPAGNVGVQIHHIHPIGSGEKVWTLGVQEVITLGRLFLEGKYYADRIVAITGAELKEPRYVKTYAGAKIGDLVKGNLNNDHIRLISGDVLSGTKKTEEQFLGFFDDQVTVVEEGDYYEMLGWLAPVTPRPSISRTFPNFLFPDLEFKADTNTHGERRAFVVTGQYEQMLPMDILPQHLMKAILISDIERMEGLGIHELSEEDVALCEFACTSKQPLQKILREGLDLIREQG